jgi:predicted deacetylase
MRNAAERKDIRRAEKAQALEETNRIEFVVAAMRTVQGRTWFHRFLSDCRVFADPFTGDALIEAHSKGERNVGLRVYNDIVNNCADEFVMMMKEANIREITDERRSTSPTGDSDSDYDPDFDDDASGT